MEVSVFCYSCKLCNHRRPRWLSSICVCSTYPCTYSEVILCSVLRCFPDLMGLPVSFQSKGYWSISTYHLPVLIRTSSGGVAKSLIIHNDPWCQEETCLVCGNRFCCSRNSTESTHSMLTWQSNHSTTHKSCSLCKSKQHICLIKQAVLPSQLCLASHLTQGIRLVIYCIHYKRSAWSLYC